MKYERTLSYAPKINACVCNRIREMSSGMIPGIWGPMVWRFIHRAAHEYDTATHALSERDALVFCLFLIRLAWVLPCSHCRVSYTDYLRSFLQVDENGGRRINAYFQQRAVRRLAVEIHDLVNQKLGKPVFANLELDRRRSAVWSSEFLEPEFFGILFIIAINYRSNGEPEKETHHRRFFELLPDLCMSLGHLRLAASLEAVELGNITPFEQEMLVNGLYEALVLWTGRRDRVPALSVLVDRYTLCRS